MIEVCATKFEAYYEDGEPVFIVEAFDEATANVTVSCLLNANEWDKISPLIRQCLVDMKLKGDVK